LRPQAGTQPERRARKKAQQQRTCAGGAEASGMGRGKSLTTKVRRAEAPRVYARHGSEKLAAALAAVPVLGLRGAAERYGVAKSTLSDHRPGGRCAAGRPPGAPPAFTVYEETEMVRIIRDGNADSQSLTSPALASYVAKLARRKVSEEIFNPAQRKCRARVARTGVLGRKFLAGFAGRHVGELTVKVGEKMERSRAEITQEQLDSALCQRSVPLQHGRVQLPARLHRARADLGL
jgi:hypothetical protein